jgi:pyridoxine kinase
MARVAAVHDLSGFGRCSLGVVLPVLAAMDIQCCALPTGFFSTHTGYDGFVFHNMTDAMRPTIDHWQSMGLTFDAVYSGFLGSADQIDIVRETIARFRRPGMLAVVDPVMGDHGQPYRTYTAEMCRQMRFLADDADLITPNITEAALLLGEDYADAPRDEAGFYGWLTRLSRDGRRSVVVTGLTVRAGQLGSAWLDAASGQSGIDFHPFVGQEFHGTGDLYASVLVGRLLHGLPLSGAVASAAAFVHDCAALSWAERTPTQGGVRFEALLSRLGADG